MHHMNEAERVGIERGFQQGLHQGLQQGRLQGRQKGEAAVLIRQLKHRFTLVPDEYLELIHEADNRSLLKWAERVLDADRIDEVFE